MIILGAGMSGCLMGAINGSSRIYEAQDSIPNNHKAVLRFREDKISKATGVQFRKVKVIKSIWYCGKEESLSPRMINFYSKKVSDKFLSRSITNLDTAERYIAPPDFHEILADICGNRIELNSRVKSITGNVIIFEKSVIDRTFTQIISTMPMNVLAEILDMKLNTVKFDFKSIRVTRYKIKDADIFQTIYYPSPDMLIYRATMTGDDLIIESIDKGMFSDDDLIEVINSFGFSPLDLHVQSETKQKYGKISPIPDGIRKQFMLNATVNFQVYSLGRYACWRNILLDDVYDDIFRIKRMIGHDHYDMRRDLNES